MDMTTNINPRKRRRPDHDYEVVPVLTKAIKEDTSPEHQAEIHAKTLALLFQGARAGTTASTRTPRTSARTAHGYSSLATRASMHCRCCLVSQTPSAAGAAPAASAPQAPLPSPPQLHECTACGMSMCASCTASCDVCGNTTVCKLCLQTDYSGPFERAICWTCCEGATT
ncbi:hypothetical protein AMAG_17249 [Allomyces macrogynus ATCC 38327]|uniref:Uncharacterized protein n=1 Tax=Allomyces macrogynus (strain ATCC 38327) TaxID=578462 RepID=A0A0L0TET8_ALLM3|nr:hypothetical protein AMAG_17249 [Allomyces macrogynus ATCC 38327]|eukprot:KNE73094.1 hypothetical protein AMAG_17249 [Allomyces macrogynus ATCC 38327]